MGAAGPEGLVRTVRAAGVRDERLLGAMRAVPRAGFVPAEQMGAAYLDRPVPIPHGQVTTQPSLSAIMIEGLALSGDEHVLEVGTGLGFQTALLAHLAAGVVRQARIRRVFSGSPLCSRAMASARSGATDRTR